VHGRFVASKNQGSEEWQGGVECTADACPGALTITSNKTKVILDNSSLLVLARRRLLLPIRHGDATKAGSNSWQSSQLQASSIGRGLVSVSSMVLTSRPSCVARGPKFGSPEIGSNMMSAATETTTAMIVNSPW